MERERKREGGGHWKEKGRRILGLCQLDLWCCDEIFFCCKSKTLKKELMRIAGETGHLDLSGLLFAIMDKKYRKETKRPKLLEALLTYSSVDVNQRAPNGSTALHSAIQVDLTNQSLLIIGKDCLPQINELFRMV